MRSNLFKSYWSSTTHIVKESHLSKPVIPEEKSKISQNRKFAKVLGSPCCTGQTFEILFC